MDLVEFVEDGPGGAGGVGEKFFRVLDWLVHGDGSPGGPASCEVHRAGFPGTSIEAVHAPALSVAIKLLNLLVVWRVEALNGTRPEGSAPPCRRMKGNDLREIRGVCETAALGETSVRS
jgi:hypothetical protein